VLYPLAVMGLAQVVFPSQANGSLERVGEVVVGSALIGQTTSDPRYIWPRPSAVGYMEGAAADAPISSGATNQGWTSAALQQAVRERAAAFASAHSLSDDPAALPPDMLFASGSGLDPHISPEAALAQVARVAQARGIDQAQVAALVNSRVEGRQLGLLGEPRVNVLLLNLALDAQQ